MKDADAEISPRVCGCFAICRLGIYISDKQSLLSHDTYGRRRHRRQRVERMRVHNLLLLAALPRPGTGRFVGAVAGRCDVA